MNDISRITAAVTDVYNTKRMPVIGIDGLGGAGKSTVAQQLCDALKEKGIHTVLIHMDDLINKREVRYTEDIPEWQCYYDRQWRYDYFTEIINKAKRSADTLQIELYDKDNDSYYTETYPIRRNTVIIVEGIFLQRKELDGIFDYMIYIDLAEAVRLGRVLDRDTYIGDRESITDKYERRYFPAEHRYCREYQPDKTADLVLGIS